MGKDGKKKSKESKSQAHNDKETPRPAAASVSVKVLKESPETSGCLLAFFSDAPAPVDLLNKDAEPYEFQCEQTGKNGARALTGQKVHRVRPVHARAALPSPVLTGHGVCRAASSSRGSSRRPNPATGTSSACMTQTKGGWRLWTLAAQARLQTSFRCSDDCAATRWRVA